MATPNIGQIDNRLTELEAKVAKQRKLLNGLGVFMLGTLLISLALLIHLLKY